MESRWRWDPQGEMWVLRIECPCGLAHDVDMRDAIGVVVDCVCSRVGFLMLNEVPNVAAAR